MQLHIMVTFALFDYWRRRIVSRIYEANPVSLCVQSRFAGLDYCNDESAKKCRKINKGEPRCQETLLRLSEVVKQFIALLNIYKWSYRKPTQVDECKNTKVTGTIILKELGKKAGVPSV